MSLGSGDALTVAGRAVVPAHAPATSRVSEDFETPRTLGNSFIPWIRKNKIFYNTSNGTDILKETLLLGVLSF